MPPFTDTELATRPNRRDRIWTREELDQQINAGRKLVLFENGVYDMTRWIRHHPGGELAVDRLLGKDATDVMRLLHPVDTIHRLVPRFRVGTLAKACAPHLLPPSAAVTAANGLTQRAGAKSGSETPPTEAKLDHAAIARDFRLLDDRLRTEGYYTTNYSSYVWEAFRQCCFFVSAIYLGVAQPFAQAWLPSAILLAMFWHQASFIVHDAGHNSITHRRSVDHVIGALLADGMGGLSIGWWKKSHNVHHIITNHPEHDPDIQLVPFFALSERFFDSIFSSYHKKQLEWNRLWKAFSMVQHWLYYPILAFGRFNLFVQGWLHLAFDEDVYMRRTEIALQTFYWIWYSAFLYALPDLNTRLLHVLISFIGTSILHVQITLSHFGMSTDDGPEDECFAVRQLRTTMDVDCPWWLDWFHGGLQFQALHHIFPQVARHKLRSIQPFVLELCQKHNLTYTYHGFIKCNGMVIHEMAKLAAKAAKTLI
ncbi:fatty acid desaturase-domain-containing protein [Thamnocephalis sphaerospora]|uniref:Fatty acid desaturase-domain-containing protein n=1 Tax=Thamnocephalis sphaerospora TaxID=78915 RepID=A0A4P9XTI8_9FUNG|nr:fatty acid desaturase-domain-containing protein [Thamnocephalis sphaerospora]|eukprot:RKP08861.1 fatty acid desaturase-domain-containing protein [Thamnocephalis sphaerospora]